MKAKENFEVVTISDDYLLIPIADQIDKFNGTVVLNEVSAFLFEKMKSDVSEEELVKFIVDEYDVDISTAKNDVKDALEKMKRIGIIYE